MPSKDRISPPAAVGLAYVFNLIVGTGALTLPAVVNKAGWISAVIVLIILAFISFITATYIVESMACANALQKWSRIQERSTQEQADGEESDPLVEQGAETDVHPLLPQTYFCIEEKYELGEMAVMFFSQWGRVLFYLCIVVYLYGDLTIYAAAVAKSLTDVACTLSVVNGSVNLSIPDTAPCWESETITRINVYRIFLAVFVLATGPFVFFNVQKTKYLQLFTTFMRWIAFSLMIGCATHKLIHDGADGSPATFAISGVPTLFGACVYSFMCHHSLPGLLTPISNKSHVVGALAADYILVASFYLVLALTGVFAYSQLEDLYTLVFWQPGQIIGYFLALFPVFTLSANFPIVAVTLRSNLRVLCSKCGLKSFLFPLFAIIPPSVLAMTTSDLSILVGITGSYAGAGVQYLIPALLVKSARKSSQTKLGMSSSASIYASPFKGSIWISLILIWTTTCVILITVNLIEKLAVEVQ